MPAVFVRRQWYAAKFLAASLCLLVSVSYASSPAQFITLGVLLTPLLLPRSDTEAGAAQSYYALLQLMRLSST